jgi:hypothetical protein
MRMLALALTLVALPSWAQIRSLPTDTERGVIRHVQEMTVAINGRNMRLAPGATIRDQRNFIVVPTSLPAQGAVAEYVINSDGELARAWLLTPEEERRPRKPAPRR